MTYRVLGLSVDPITSKIRRVVVERPTFSAALWSKYMMCQSGWRAVVIPTFSKEEVGA